MPQAEMLAIVSRPDVIVQGKHVAGGNYAMPCSGAADSSTLGNCIAAATLDTASWGICVRVYVDMIQGRCVSVV